MYRFIRTKCPQVIYLTMIVKVGVISNKIDLIVKNVEIPRLI